MGFYNPDDFPMLSSLKQNWQMIRAEYDAIASKARIWPEPIHNGGWHVFGLRFQDQDLPDQEYAPLTTKLCASILGSHTFGFSTLSPGCEITPHIGYTDQVLRVHLALYSNPHSGLKVGDQTQLWKEGELLVFDDRVLHSAWNHGRWGRTVLIIDVYKSALGFPLSALAGHYL